jgi:hypothetical protein
MRKGFFASVAALAASAGVACGQGSPAAGPGPVMSPTPAYPGYGTAAMSAPVPVPVAPAGLKSGTALPTAGPGDMPHNGPVPQPGVYDPWAHGPSYDPGAPPADYGNGPGGGSTQIHKAAGGPDRFWVDVEWLLWRPKSGPIGFPLLTAGPPVIDPTGNVSGGVLGQDGTRILVGDHVHYGDYTNGLRVTTGWWNCDRTWGLEWSGFIMEKKSEIANFFAPLNSQEILARPAIDALTGTPIALVVSVPSGFPLERAGEAHYKSTLNLGGTEVNLLRSCMYCDTFKLSVLAGVRYIDYVEKLSVITRSSFPTSPDGSTPPDLLDIVDEFNVRNQYLGGQVGFQAEFRAGRCFADVTGKIALGNQNEQLDISGFTNQSVGGTNTSVVGGWLALPTNIGKSNLDHFAYVPEVTLNFGYQWTQRISTYIGYNFLYISRLIRPGDQIDAQINPTLVPVSGAAGPFGPPRPARFFNETDFWMQGATLGLSIRY